MLSICSEESWAPEFVKSNFCLKNLHHRVSLWEIEMKSIFQGLFKKNLISTSGEVSNHLVLFLLKLRYLLNQLRKPIYDTSFFYPEFGLQYQTDEHWHCLFLVVDAFQLELHRTFAESKSVVWNLQRKISNHAQKIREDLCSSLIP